MAQENIGTTARERGFFARHAMVLLCAGVALIALISAIAISHNAGVRLEQAEADYAQAQSNTEQLQGQAGDQTVQIVKDTSGVDMERKADDDEKVSKIMSLATTWSTGKEYNDNRAALMDRYGLKKDSAFLTTFMPDQRCRTTTDGTEICMIDADNLASSFSRMDSSIIDVKGSTYTYFAVVTISTPSADGSVSVSTENPVIYSVNGRGEVTDITPYAVASQGAAMGSV